LRELCGIRTDLDDGAGQGMSLVPDEWIVCDIADVPARAKLSNSNCTVGVTGHCPDGR